jgi:hypothetical protein
MTLLRHCTSALWLLIETASVAVLKMALTPSSRSGWSFTAGRWGGMR